MRYVAVLLTLALVVPLVPLSLAVDPEETGATELATQQLPVGKIGAILSPLPAVPTFLATAGTLRVEFAIPAEPLVGGAGCFLGYYPGEHIFCTAATLTPVGGGPSVLLEFVADVKEPSRVWPDGREVLAVTYQKDAPGPIPAGFYDLWTFYVLKNGASAEATSLRSVAVVDSFAENPRIAIVGDPQVGDPRALEDGARDSMAEESPEAFLAVAEETMFAFPDNWPAFEEAIAQINEFQPDFVLITGDVTFGQDAPGKYFTEYELAWELVQQFTVPTFLSLGNHDGYVQGGVDGFVLWERYFGPTHYAVDYGPDVHLVSINTYDWSELDRMGIGLGVSAWGGQIRAEQLAWLTADLAAFRARSPDGLLFTFAHHSPSWIQDRWETHDMAPPNGVPVVEQVVRAPISFGTTDQHWSGDNRLALRDLLREQDVTVHFAGHTHVDRVARDDGHGIAETGQNGGFEPDGTLHYVLRDDTLSAAYTQAQLAARMADWSLGPFYVETTTASSSTTQYWGWRPVDLVSDGNGGFQLSEFGCDGITQAWLDAHAREPERWNADHASVGLFSCPTYPDGP